MIATPEIRRGLATLGGMVAWLFVSLASLLYCCGCTVTHGDSNLSLMQLAPGEDVQSSTATIVGLEVMPMGVDGPAVRLGYVRSQRSRVPGYDVGTTMPYVRIETKVDGNGALVGESLEVNDEAPPAGIFGRR